MVVSGAPEKEQNHAEKVCDMALDMIEAITDLKDPSTGTIVQIIKRQQICIHMVYFRQGRICGYESVFTLVLWWRVSSG